MLEEVDVLVNDIETELGQEVTGRAVTVEGFPEGEVAGDVGAHVLPRGEGGHVVVVFYHTHHNRKFRAVMVRRKIRPWAEKGVSAGVEQSNHHSVVRG